MVQVMKWYSISLRIFDIKKPKTENVHPGFLQNEAAGSTGIQSHFLGWDASSSHVTLPTLLVFPQLPLGKVPYLRKVQSAVEPSGTFRQSLSWFLQHEPTRSIVTPPGWEAWVTSKHLVSFPWQINSTHTYSWVETSTLRIKCLSQEHNTKILQGLDQRSVDAESKLQLFIQWIMLSKGYKSLSDRLCSTFCQHISVVK